MELKTESTEYCSICDEEILFEHDVTEENGQVYHTDCIDEMRSEWAAEKWEAENDPDSPDYLIDGVGFADPGGGSALRAATKDNPRNLPCPTCGRQGMLTPLDRARGYQCDICADQAERGGY